jgi:sugar lactone lactonase YvrE
MSQAVLEQPDVDVVVPGGALIGESPTWVPEERLLYWVDIKAPALYCLDVDREMQVAWRLPAHVGAFALLDRSAAIVALRDGLFRLDLKSGGLDRLAPPPFDPALFRFNEGIIDDTGRFWIGTMLDPLVAGDPPYRSAGLHSFSRVEGLRSHPHPAEIHNGMAFGPGGRSFWIAQSEDGSIRQHRFDPGSGSLGEGALFATVPPSVGVPDGAAVDAQGCYWVAIHGGGRLRRFTPGGDLDREIFLPVSRPTMCCFAGDALDTLYVTSASDGLSAAERAAEPLAGALLRLKPGVKGHPKPIYCR